MGKFGATLVSAGALIANFDSEFITWLAGLAAQKIIDNFTINGQHPFRSAPIRGAY